MSDGKEMNGGGSIEPAKDRDPNLPIVGDAKQHENLALWLAVWETDPAFTKNFKKGGGFGGTATNVTFLQMRATAIFGPKGIGWGTIELESKIEGHDLLEFTDSNGKVTTAAPHKIWFTHLKLWYIHPATGVRGEVDQWGGTDFVYTDKNGLKVDDEAAKKSATDALTKCLSAIGFAADIHLGRFDDNKYVERMREKFSKSRERKVGDRGREQRDKNEAGGDGNRNRNAGGGDRGGNLNGNHPGNGSAGGSPPGGPSEADKKKADDSRRSAIQLAMRRCEDAIRDATTEARLRELHRSIDDPVRAFNQGERNALHRKANERAKSLNIPFQYEIQPGAAANGHH